MFDLQKSSVKMEIKSGDLKLRVKCSKDTEEKKFSMRMMVEVKSDEQGYHGSWYIAAITCPVTDDKFWLNIKR